jgi:RNA polymerase sigma-70 factor, ECF subfamily
VTSELIALAQRGDHEAFETLVRASYDHLYAVARRILRDPSLAEDAVQNALVRAWRDLRGLRDPDRFEAWLSRLLINACHDEGRRARRRPIEVAVLPIDRAADGDAAAQLAERDAIERAFLRLSVEHRAALVLTHYLGYPAAEVAVICGVPIGTVYSRLHAGAAAMRAALEGAAPTASRTPEHVR